MKVNKKLLLSFVIIVLLSLTSALGNTANADGSWNFDSNAEDQSGNATTATVGNCNVNNSVYHVGSGSYWCSGTSSYINLNDPMIGTSNTPFAVSGWFYLDDASADQLLFQSGVLNTNGFYVYQIGSLGDLRIQFDGGATSPKRFDIAGLNLNSSQWFHLVLDFSGTTTRLYLNGENKGGRAMSYTTPTTNMNLMSNNGSGIFTTGNVDQYIVYGRNLTQADLDELFNGGAGFDPYATTTTPTDKVYPQTIEFDFNNSVLVNSVSPQIIYSESFTAINTSFAYTNWIVELEALNKNIDVTCEILLDGNEIGSSVTRTILSGNTANLYLFSDEFNITQGVAYTVDLQCQRNVSPGALYRINQASSLVNVYTSATGNPINHVHFDVNATLNSTSYLPLFRYEFNTSNLSGEPNILSVFADGNIQFNYTSTGTITLYATVDGESSPEFLRYGAAGTVGNGGGLYLLKNLTNQTAYNFTIYGKSTSADGKINIKGVLTEIFVDDLEVERHNLTGKTATTGTWATIDTLYINNTVSGGAILAKTAFSVESNSGTQTLFYRLKAGSETSLEYARTITAGQSGMAALQHAFGDIGLTNQSIELQAYTSTTGATLTGGSLFAHVTEEIPSTAEFYTVQARNEWDNSSITSFNVTVNDNLIYFSNASGYATIYSEANALQNLTIQATDYFAQDVLNHNTSDNLVVDLYQSDIKFNATQLITNASVSGNITIDGQTKATGESFFLAAGSYNATFSASGYFPKTQEITVAALDNTTFTIVNVGNSLLKLNATNLVSGAAENAFNVTFWYNGENLDNYTTTNGSIFIPVVQGSNFTIIVDDNLHALQTFYIVPTSTYHNETLVLATTNSVFITFRDEVSKALINGTNMTALLVGANSYTYTTTNGTLYADLITPSEYEIRYYSTNVDDYKLRSFFFELTNLSFNNITLYALNESENVNFTTATITFNVLDDNFNPVENAKVVVQRYYADQNGYVSVWERYTNSDGYARGVFETFDAFYKYNVYYNDELKFSSSNNGVQFTTDETFTIYISTLSNYGAGIATVNDLAYTSELDFAQTGNFTGYFELNYTNENLLQICLWVEYLNGTSVSSSCQSSSSGTIQSSVSAPTDQSTTYVAYAVGYEPITEQYIVFSTDSHTFRVLDLLGSNDDITSAAAFVAVLILTAIGLLLIKYPVVAVLTQTALFIFIILSPIPFIIGEIPTTIAWIVSVAITAVVILVRGKNE